MGDYSGWDWVDWCGRLFPDFTLTDTTGKTHRWADYTDKAYLVLFALDLAEEPAALAETLGIEAQREAFAAEGAVVLGLVAHGPEEVTPWAQRHGLGFPILCDPQASLLARLELWDPRQRRVKRETFLVGPNGLIASHWPLRQEQFDAGHAQDVLEVLRQQRDWGVGLGPLPPEAQES